MSLVQKTILFTSGSGSFTIPEDFISLYSVEAIGGGGAGNQRNDCGGGGGAFTYNQSIPGLAPGSTCYYQVGAGGTNGNPGQASWFCSNGNNAPSNSLYGVYADFGGSNNKSSSTAFALGGQDSNCIPGAPIAQSGGNGGAGNGTASGGGGGAAGRYNINLPPLEGGNGGAGINAHNSAPLGNAYPTYSGQVIGGGGGAAGGNYNPSTGSYGSQGNSGTYVAINDAYGYVSGQTYQSYTGGTGGPPGPGPVSGAGGTGAFYSTGIVIETISGHNYDEIQTNYSSASPGTNGGGGGGAIIYGTAASNAVGGQGSTLNVYYGCVYPFLTGNATWAGPGGGGGGSATSVPVVISGYPTYASAGGNYGGGGGAASTANTGNGAGGLIAFIYNINRTFNVTIGPGVTVKSGITIGDVSDNSYGSMVIP
jgi:hypothetical protein